MKKIFTLLLLVVSSFSLQAQAVFADPALDQVFIASAEGQALDVPPTLTRQTIYQLKLPILNLSTVNSIPAGTTKIKIGLGSKMILDPAFDLSTTNTSAYFSWTSETVGGQVQLTGNQIAAIPPGFSQTGLFLVKGVILGLSTITANFLVTNHNNASVTLSDENGANNLSSQAYFITETVPVDFTGIQVKNGNCAVAVSFSVENEVNLRRYVIEYAADGVNFSPAGQLLPTGSRNYFFKFDLPSVITGGVIYVRVKSVDLDGRFQYTSIKVLRDLCNTASAVSLYPNPVADNQGFITITKNLGLFNGSYTVTLFDVTGKKLEALRLQLVNAGSFKYNVNRLAAATYTLKIETAAENPAVLRFQKMN
jgi:hypothetical protein